MTIFINEDYLRNSIMQQSRHQFIYGYDNDKRKSILQKINSEYPIKLDSDYPMSIYLRECGLPMISSISDELDKSRIDIISREYLSFTIAHAILQKSQNDIDIDIISSRISRLLSLLNKYNVNPNHKGVTSFEELLLTLEESKEFYMSYYLDYVQFGKEERSITDIKMPFMQLEYFVKQYKRVLNNSSYFGIIIDKSEDISLSSTKAINSLIGSRINADISMKIVVEPNKWQSYSASNGQFIEAVHDYGIVELDESHSEYVKKKRTQFDNND